MNNPLVFWLSVEDESFLRKAIKWIHVAQEKKKRKEKSGKVSSGFHLSIPNCAVYMKPRHIWEKTVLWILYMILLQQFYYMIITVVFTWEKVKSLKSLLDFLRTSSNLKSFKIFFTISNQQLWSLPSPHVNFYYPYYKLFIYICWEFKINVYLQRIAKSSR